MPASIRSYKPSDCSGSLGRRIQGCRRAVNTVFFVEWVRRRLAPHDIVLLDNVKAHKAPDVRRLVEARGATLRYLPPFY